MRPADYARQDRRLPAQYLVSEWFDADPPESAIDLMSVPGLDGAF